jgi:hypothetical protein
MRSMSTVCRSQKRISGPLLDRIDIHIDVLPHQRRLLRWKICHPTIGWMNLRPPLRRCDTTPVHRQGVAGVFFSLGVGGPP